MWTCNAARERTCRVRWMTAMMDELVASLNVTRSIRQYLINILTVICNKHFVGHRPPATRADTCSCPSGVFNGTACPVVCRSWWQKQFIKGIAGELRFCRHNLPKQSGIKPHDTWALDRGTARKERNAKRGKEKGNGRREREDWRNEKKDKPYFASCRNPKHVVIGVHGPTSEHEIGFGILHFLLELT